MQHRLWITLLPLVATVAAALPSSAQDTAKQVGQNSFQLAQAKIDSKSVQPKGTGEQESAFEKLAAEVRVLQTQIRQQHEEIAQLKPLLATVAQQKAEIDKLKAQLTADSKIAHDADFKAGIAVNWINSNGAGVVQAAKSYANHVHSYSVPNLHWKENTCVNGANNVSSSSTVPCAVIGKSADAVLTTTAPK